MLIAWLAQPLRDMSINTHTELLRVIVMIARAISLLMAAGAFASSTQADWTYGRVPDEFDQKHRYVAISSLQDPALAFICESETGRMKLLYKSGETASAFFRKRFPMPFISAYVLVDDQPIRSFQGSLIGIDKKIAFESYEDEAVAFSKIVAKAHRRVLIAIQLGSEKHFRNEVTVTGSADPINAVLQACSKYRR